MYTYHTCVKTTSRIWCIILVLRRRSGRSILIFTRARDRDFYTDFVVDRDVVKQSRSHYPTCTVKIKHYNIIDIADIVMLCKCSTGGERTCRRKTLTRSHKKREARRWYSTRVHTPPTSIVNRHRHYYCCTYSYVWRDVKSDKWRHHRRQYVYRPGRRQRYAANNSILIMTAELATTAENISY